MNMNIKNKQEVIMQLIATLTAMLAEEERTNEVVSYESEREEKVEFLTIKQAAEVVVGISEHTIRQLVVQNKVKYIRTDKETGKSINKQSCSLTAITTVINPTVSLRYRLSFFEKWYNYIRDMPCKEVSWLI